jgi:hypothetical protein
MPKRAKDADGLTAQEGKYCLHRSRGSSQRQAYEQAFPKSRATPETIDNLACKLEKRSEVQARIKELLRSMKAADIVSQGEWLQWVNEVAKEAHGSKQYAAAIQGLRLIGQANGAISDRALGQSELGFSEENLLERLSGGDPDKKRLLASLLGKPSFASSVQTATDSHTKH